MTGVRTRDHADAAVGWLDEVDTAGSSAGQLQGGPLDGGRRERMLGDRDDAVAARGVGPDPPLVVDVQAEPGAPGGAVGRLGGVVRGEPQRAGRLDLDRQIDAAHALQGVGDDLLLEHALMREVDVPEVGAAWSEPRRRADVGVMPDVRLTVRRGIQDLERLTAQEAARVGGRAARGLGQADPHRLARNRVGHEDDSPLVPAHEHAAMGDIGDLEVDQCSGIHSPTLPHERLLPQHRTRRRPLPWWSCA